MTLHTNETRRPSLGMALIGSAVPAYLIPAVTTYLNAQFIPDQEVAHRLAAASYTTIAIPSAAAATLVTWWCHHRTPPARQSRATSIRAMGLAALGCVLLAVAGSMVLIGNGLQPAAILQYTITSAAVGGALSARRWARSGARARRRSGPGAVGRPGTDSVVTAEVCGLAAGQGVRP